MARLARINIHPVKSLDAYSVERAVVLPSGALAGDRRWAMRDLQGEIVNGKRMPQVHRLRTTFEPQTGRISIRVEGVPRPMCSIWRITAANCRGGWGGISTFPWK
jgi:uncharacterized protein